MIRRERAPGAEPRLPFLNTSRKAGQTARPVRTSKQQRQTVTGSQSAPQDQRALAAPQDRKALDARIATENRIVQPGRIALQDQRVLDARIATENRIVQPGRIALQDRKALDALPAQNDPGVPRTRVPALNWKNWQPRRIQTSSSVATQSKKR